MQEFTKKLEVDFSFMSYAPFVFISALTGQRVDKLFEQIKVHLFAEYKTYLDRYSQRYAGICYRKSTAPVGQGQAAEAVLYDAGIGKASDVCNFLQR